MRAALDSNILIYAEDVFGDPRRELALDLVARLSVDDLLLPLQALGETLQWLIRKGKVPKSVAAARVSEWAERFVTVPTTATAFNGARELVRSHDFPMWDAVILAVSEEAGAEVLLSEDLQHGFSWKGVTVVDPFRPESQTFVRAL